MNTPTDSIDHKIPQLTKGRWKLFWATVILILKKDLITLLRTWKAFVVILALVLAASLFPLVHWPEQGQVMASYHARSAFFTFKAVFYIGGILFVPMITASSFVLEREDGTLDTLLASPLSLGGIVFGKLLASTSLFLIAFSFSFPILIVVQLLGGFEFLDFLQMAAEIFVGTLFLGSVGIECSTRSKSGLGAILITYLWLALHLFLLTLISWFCGMVIFTVFDGLLSMFSDIHAIILVALFYIALISLYCWILLRSAAYKLTLAGQREIALLEPEEEGQVGARIKWRGLRTRSLFDKFKSSENVSWNPLFQKGVKTSVFGNGVFQYFIFWTLVAVAWPILMSSIGMGVHTVLSRIFILNMIVIGCALVLVPGASVMALLPDFRQDLFDFIKLSKLKPNDVLFGAFRTSLHGTMGLFMLIGANCIFLFIFLLAGQHPQPILMSFVFLIVHLGLLLIIITNSIVCASVSILFLKNSLLSLMSTYFLFIVTLFFVPGILESVIDAWLNKHYTIDLILVSRAIFSFHEYSFQRSSHWLSLVPFFLTTTLLILAFYSISLFKLKRIWGATSE